MDVSRRQSTARPARAARPLVEAELRRLRCLRRHALVAGRRNAADFPWREQPTPYTVLVAEVLLQHTPSARVIPVFRRVVGRWQGFRALANANVRELAGLLRPLGLQQRRAGALVAMSKAVASEWDGKLPCDAAMLRRLPGVGAYTAGVTIAVATNRRAGFVDAGLARLFRRYLGLAPGPVRDPQLEMLTQRLVRDGDARLVAWGLLDLSRTVCRPRPLCGACPVSIRCAYVKRVK